jgi:hypothetical protein
LRDWRQGGISVFEQQIRITTRSPRGFLALEKRGRVPLPELHRLLLAVRRQGAQAAQVRVLAPAPSRRHSRL